MPLAAAISPLWAYCDLGRFRFVRTGRRDHCPTSQFESETGFFQEFLLKNHLFRAYYCIHDLTDLAREFWLKGKYHCDGNGLSRGSGLLVLTNGKLPKSTTHPFLVSSRNAPPHLGRSVTTLKTAVYSRLTVTHPVHDGFEWLVQCGRSYTRVNFRYSFQTTVWILSRPSRVYWRKKDATSKDPIIST